jgi:hypothetical protein
MAQREEDPQRLASIIDEMNRLLDAYEKKTARIARQRQSENDHSDLVSAST